jgi:hypothetical protein
MKTWGSGGIAPLLLISALDGGQRSASRPDSFTPGETFAGTNWRGGWMASRAGLNAEENRIIVPLWFPAVYNNNNNHHHHRIVYDVKGPTNKVNRIENVCQRTDNQSYEDGSVTNSRLVLCVKYASICLSICGSTVLFLDLGRFFSLLIYTQSVGLLGRGISQSQGRYPRKQTNTNTK